MSARVPGRGTGMEQAVVAVKDRNGSGAKGLPHCAMVLRQPRATMPVGGQL